jgi:hypothetical protein
MTSSSAKSAYPSRAGVKFQLSLLALHTQLARLAWNISYLCLVGGGEAITAERVLRLLSPLALSPARSHLGHTQSPERMQLARHNPRGEAFCMAKADFSYLEGPSACLSATKCIAQPLLQNIPTYVMRDGCCERHFVKMGSCNLQARQIEETAMAERKTTMCLEITAY